MSASNRWSRGSIAALALSFAATCVPLVEYDGLPCPCGEGYECCETENACLPKEDYDASVCSQPMSAGSSNGGRTSSGLGGAPGSAGAAEGGSPGSAGALAAASDDAGGSAGSGGVAGASGSVNEDGGGGQAGDAGAGGSGGSIEPSECSAYPRTSNVLVLIYSPLLESGLDLQTATNLHDGRALSAELVAYARAASGGLLNYNIVETRIVNYWPPQLPGAMVLDEVSFNNGVYDPDVVYPGGNADYAVMFADQDVCYAVSQQNVSEVWLWGAHGGNVNFGFDTFSYRLASDQLPEGLTAEEFSTYDRRRRNLPDCGRALWVQSGLYSAAYDAKTLAKHFYNLRVHEVLGWALRTRATDPTAAAARWAEFSSYERDSLLPDLANVGTPDYPPNAGIYDDADEDGVLDPVQPLDYDDTDLVYSGAHLWLQYPNLEGEPELINSSAWGSTADGFHHWYLAHIPHNDGVSPNGTCNSWWKYFADPDGALAPCSGDGCKAPLGIPCASDSECASGHCACQGNLGTWAACSETAGVACPSSDWLPCNDHEDCRSQRCGCHFGAGPKICLPNDSFPTECN